MSSEQQTDDGHAVELKRFLQRFFERRGAAVEASGDGLEALLPERLMQELSVEEFIRVEPAAGAASGRTDLSPEAPAYPMAYGSEFLERILNLACGGVPVAHCRVEFTYLKSQGFEALIREALTFKGANLRVEQWARVDTTYLILTSRYSARSDEQKEGIFELGVNLETGALVPALGARLESSMRSFDAGGIDMRQVMGRVRNVWPGFKRALEEVLRRETASFQESMNRKFRRDAAHLEAYYRSVEKEMQQSLGRSGLSDQLVRERRAKIALLPAELDRKRDDLCNKYSIRIAATPCAALLVSTPAVRVLLQASVGKRRRSLSVFYNPITKTVDLPVCEGCGGSSAVMAFCDRPHLLCPGCAAVCPICRPAA